MKNFNRRQWLKSIGLAGSATLIGNYHAFSNNYPEKLVEGISEYDSEIFQLNANENPYGPSERVRRAMIDAFSKGCRYPFRFRSELINEIASKEGVEPEHIVLTAGSTEGLRLTGLTHGIHGGEIIAADPTFQALLTYAKNFGASINRVPLDSRMLHDLREMDRRITSNTRLVFICNPNNPTGTLLPAGDLIDFCEVNSKRTVIFSDEAYYDFIEDSGYPSMTKLVKKGHNVIVSRTFSKVYGLAGIRIGYLIARPDIAKKLNDALVASANVLGIYAALAAIKDEEFYNKSIERNESGKRMMYEAFEKLDIEYIKSETNFIFFRTGIEIRDFIGKMRASGVEVGRPFPPLTKWCRISTGTTMANEKFVSALKKTMSK